MLKRSLIIVSFILLWLIGHEILIEYRFEQNRLYLQAKIEQEIKQLVATDKAYFERLAKFLLANPDVEIDTYTTTTLRQIKNNELKAEHLALAKQAFNYPKFNAVTSINHANNQSEVLIVLMSEITMFYDYTVILKYSEQINNSKDKTYNIGTEIPVNAEFKVFYDLNHTKRIYSIRDWLDLT